MANAKAANDEPKPFNCQGLTKSLFCRMTCDNPITSGWSYWTNNGPGKLKPGFRCLTCSSVMRRMKQTGWIEVTEDGGDANPRRA